MYVFFRGYAENILILLEGILTPECFCIWGNHNIYMRLTSMSKSFPLSYGEIQDIGW